MSNPGERLHLPSRSAAAVVALLFAVGVAAPLARWAVTGERDRSAREERRTPAPAPELGLDPETLAAVPDAATAWFADAFPFRRALVRAHNAAVWFGLGDSPSELMLRGDDDWLYLRAGRTLDVHRGILLDEPTLEGYVRRYLEWRDWLAARDADYLLLIAPEKPDVYPEHLPDWAGEPPARTRTDQFVERARARGLAVVHARGPILAEKRERLVYHPLGTHWNGAGAFAAYEALIEALARFQPLQRPLSRERFELADETHPLVDADRDDATAQMLLADLVDQPVVTYLQRPPLPWTLVRASDPGREPSEVVTSIPDPRFPRAVLSPDSFGLWIWPYLANHFSRLHSHSGPRFNVELVERERPDVVLSVRVERFLTEDRITPLDLDPTEIATARAWNAAAPLTVGPAGTGVSIEGAAGPTLWLRAERELALEPGPGDDALRWRGRLRDAAGAERAVELSFAAGRRWAFAALEGVALPASLSPSEGAPPIGPAGGVPGALDLDARAGNPAGGEGGR